MKKIKILFALTAVTISSIFTNQVLAQNVTPNQMVNIAGKQRMLSQKIAKIYLMNAYGANLNSLKSELNISKIIFERNLETLNKNSSKLFSANVGKAVSKERETWSSLKYILSRPITENNVSKVLDISNQLLKNSHAVVVAIKNESFDTNDFSTNTQLLNIIDISGKQRMLSQRLCLYFVAKKFALKNKTKSLRNDTALYAVYNELDEELINLLNSEANTLEVEEAIGNTMLTFENLRANKDNFLDGTASLNVVYNTTNRLTKDFDKLTSKYSELKVEDGSFISAR